MRRSIGPILFSVGVAVILSVAGLVPESSAREDTACYPKIDIHGINYVVGYGSLMDAASKKRSWPKSSGDRPASIQGFERAWNVRGTSIGFSTTFLGVTQQADAKMVTALYRVGDPVSFAAGDTREAPYCRVRVSPERISMLDGSATPDDGDIWIYVVRPDHLQPADANYPIVQSYVDIFLNGCIELAKHAVNKDFDFVTACITTTEGWSTHWVNDRANPRRPYDEPNAFLIDKLLHRMLPKEFEAIRIE